jgi:uncharacterized phage-associated protein
MPAPYKVGDIANFFISKSLETGRAVTPLQLQKLIYFAHGWNLGITKTPLILENIEAWKNGPVIEELYHEFKRYSYNPISEFSEQISGQDLSEPVLDETTTLFLEKIWTTYSKRSGLDLSRLSHEVGSPWHTIVTKLGGVYRIPANKVIPNDLIEKYFNSKLEAQN